ncbi:uroporphyrinogen-III synthase [Prauserella marina]|uniref:Uroporphyrinogen-III synthase n=1 Tax=Prauserella marina TaxID=530584 RepID=A0A222VK95_9PSEU|nr:uroporphyrinogen-III synthase [Prauserella marina]ASR34349.1 uroporphyrinogen-III synthase [Prauserella marina]PWV71861.1 uroporphyrinogen-III synthase [Prauserella marina]SDD89508.1 uroporphyrinogen-III synthase [Prauserella marina]
MTEVRPLAGFSIGVTAARRADELGALLVRKGASVRYGPAIRIVPLADDTELRAATETLLDHSASAVDIVVATTGIGFRGWFEAAEGWGLGDELLATLGRTRLLTRGPKAKGAVRAAGLSEVYSPESESNAELLRHLLDSGVGGMRIAVQLHGEPLPHFVHTLRSAGAEVIEVPVYRWVGPADPGPLDRLIDAVLDGCVDALPFTSAPAVASMLAMARRTGRDAALVDALGSRVVVACVGPITAGPLAALGIPTVQPRRSRIGALARTLGEELVARSPSMCAAGRDVRLRGQAALVDGELREVAPAPMAVLRALAARPGRVVSRKELRDVLPSGGEDHAVETAIGRLRTALGEAGLVQTVVKRGYRLAVTVGDGERR